MVHVAASCGAVKCLSLLLSLSGIDLTIADAESGWNALHKAVYFMQIPCMMLLLQHHAPSSQRDRDGWTPFELLTSELGMTVMCTLK